MATFSAGFAMVNDSNPIKVYGIPQKTMECMPNAECYAGPCPYIAVCDRSVDLNGDIGAKAELYRRSLGAGGLGVNGMCVRQTSRHKTG